MPAGPPSGHSIRIERTWDGAPAAPTETVRLAVEQPEGGLIVQIEAPFHDDPAPASGERLWEHEVVELFLVGADGRYLELEFGPWGHWLALCFERPREPTECRPAVRYEAARRAGRWTGRAVLEDAWPEPIARWNAFAIHGSEPDRRYLAAHPLPGPAPDFHQPHRFPDWPPECERKS